MNISELSIRRPVMTTLLMLALLVFGAMAFLKLPVSDLPNVDFPIIMVSAALPGASPETMASAVATPLEKQFSTIAGIESMSSTSVQGATQISLQFTLDRNIDAAAQDVQAAISQSARILPQDMPSPPSYMKVNPSIQPILFVALTSPTLRLSELDEYGETLMAQRISTINGVAQVVIYGSQKKAVRVQVNPLAMASMGIGLEEVAAAIQAANVNLPTGILYGPYRAVTVQATGQLNEAEDYRPQVVTYRQGRPVRLEEVANVLDSVENDKVSAFFVDAKSARPSIVLAIQRQPGTNTVEVSDAVKRLLPTFRSQLPASVDMQIMYDKSSNIKESTRDVEFTLVLTLGLVVMVIFLFLRNFSATVIPSLTLPMSVVGTFAAMYALGFSLDNLSLMALTLSVGFVVDDAIVMLENIFRHMEMGKSALQAAVEGSREIVFTILSMTLSLAAVFIPFLLLPGLVGRLFREFSVCIGVAVLISGFISLTLTPMLASRFLRAPGQVRHGAAYRLVEGVFDGMVRFYGWTLRGVLKAKFLTMLVLVGVLVGTVYLFMIVPKGFIPSEDQGFVFAQIEAAEGISPRSMAAHQQEMATALQDDPNFEFFLTVTGMSGPGGVSSANKGIMFFKLKPRNQRPLSADQIVSMIYKKASNIAGIKVFPQNPAVIPTSPRSTMGQYQFTLLGSDTTQLFAYAQELEDRLKKQQGFVGVSSDLQIKNPQVSVDINRDLARSLGITAAQIESTLQLAYGSGQISTILAPQNQYQVILEALPQFQLTPSDLSLLYVRSGSGKMVPLSTVANIKENYGPLSVNHTGQIPSVTLSYNLAPGMSLGESLKIVDDLGAKRPASVTISRQGAAQQFTGSQSDMMMLGAVTILVIYIVLGILYESFIHPITILSALPFAGFGAVATLVIFNVELSLYAFVGIIMLIGLVKKNGIMMIDFALAVQREGKSPRDAMYQACLVRFRPITMTTLAALMAGLPIALGFGAGAESRRPLGLAVVGGLVFSQTLTLYATPVVYLVMEWLRQKLGRRPKTALPAILLEEKASHPD